MADQPLVGIIMGSTSGWETMRHAADVLDDVWADMGPRFIPWMNGPEPPSKPFREWSREDSKASTTRAVRHAYRQQVADLALAHLLAEADVLPPAPED